MSGNSLAKQLRSLKHTMDTTGSNSQSIITADAEVTGSIKTTSGDVSVGGSCQSTSSVSGNIRVEGDIQGSASSVSGDVSASGGIGGSTSTVSGRINGAKKK